jgi:hypothetical protein
LEIEREDLLGRHRNKGICYSHLLDIVVFFAFFSFPKFPILAKFYITERLGMVKINVGTI